MTNVGRDERSSLILKYNLEDKDKVEDYEEARQNWQVGEAFACQGEEVCVPARRPINIPHLKNELPPKTSYVFFNICHVNMSYFPKRGG